MRKLASVQEVLEIRDMAGMEFLQVAKVLGWNVIINRQEGISVGDKVVYVEIDSQLPESEKWPEFEFLRKYKFKIKTMKMHGEYSQGLILPISILEKVLPNKQYDIGLDVTKELEIFQFNEEKPVTVVNGKIVQKRVYKFDWIPWQAMHWMYEHTYWLYKLLTTNAGSNFPPFVPKTDETRVQLMQPLLTKYAGEPFYYTEKLDGQSWTGYIHKDKYGVCSRNIDLDINNYAHQHMQICEELGMKDKLNTLREATGSDWSLQGELVGPDIQGNKLKLKERTIYFFNAFNIDKQRYADLAEFLHICNMLGVNHVPIISASYKLDDNIDTLVELAKGNSVITPGVKREGIVLRPLYDTLDFNIQYLIRGRVSFKAINPEWLIKFKE